MIQNIPFTSEHDQFLRNHDSMLRSHDSMLHDSIKRLGSLEIRFDILENKVDKLEHKVDKLENKVDQLVVTVQEGFRRTDVMYEDLRSMFNTVIDLVLHIGQKVDGLIGVQDQVKNHEVRIELIESQLKKDA